MKHWRKAVIALLVAPGMAALLLQILPREPGWYSALLLFVPLVLAAGASALAPEPGTLPPRLCRFRSLTAAAACYALGILLTVALNFSVSELFRGELVRVVAAFGLLLVFALFAGRSAGKSRKARWIIAAGFFARHAGDEESRRGGSSRRDSSSPAWRAEFRSAWRSPRSREWIRSRVFRSAFWRRPS